MIVVSRRERIDFVLAEDRESDKPTVLKLRPLTLFESIEIEDFAGEKAIAGTMPAGTINYRVCKKGLVGCENLVDAEGKVVPFTVDGTGEVDDEFLVLFTPRQRTEIAEAILGLGQVSKDDEKN